jgi:hypothetical protein
MIIHKVTALMQEQPSLAVPNSAPETMEAKRVQKPYLTWPMSDGIDTGAVDLPGTESGCPHTSTR